MKIYDYVTKVVQLMLYTISSLGVSCHIIHQNELQTEMIHENLQLCDKTCSVDVLQDIITGRLLLHNKPKSTKHSEL